MGRAVDTTRTRSQPSHLAHSGQTPVSQPLRTHRGIRRANRPEPLRQRRGYVAVPHPQHRGRFRDLGKPRRLLTVPEWQGQEAEVGCAAQVLFGHALRPYELRSQRGATPPQSGRQPGRVAGSLLVELESRESSTRRPTLDSRSSDSTTASKTSIPRDIQKLRCSLATKRHRASS